MIRRIFIFKESPIKRLAHIVLCALFSSTLIAPVSNAAPDKALLRICASLKTGYQLISKTGKCNEKFYETSTWYVAGKAPRGIPGSKTVSITVCTSKSRSNSQTLLKKGRSCNRTTQTQSKWQRPLGPPAAPKLISLTEDTLGTALIIKMAPLGDGGARIRSYEVIEVGSTNASSKSLAIVATSFPIKAQQSAKITGLIPGQDYRIAIRAINAIGVSPLSQSSAAFLAPTLPGAPSITSAVANSNNSVLITYSPTPSDGGSPITGYTITASPGGMQSTFIATDSKSHTFTGLSALITYTFTISATNIVGSSLASAPSKQITTFAPLPPAEPVVPATSTSPSSAPVAPATSTSPSSSSTPTITVGAAAKVAITRTSAGTAHHSAFTTQPQITIQDSNNNTVTTSSAIVTATVSAGGTLVGTTTATASSGVATFTGLGVDGIIGTTYTITYTSVGSTVATATVTLTGTTCDGTTFTCQVGDSGPGGGIVYYVSASPFTSTGSTCNTTCKYLEAAPTSGTNAWINPVTDGQRGAPWSGNTTTAIGVTAQGTAIGTGYANTLAIVGQSGGGAERAGTIARAYGGPNNLSDWFLPSKNELNQMCKWARGITGVNLTTLTTVCAGGTLNTGLGAAGFLVRDYYSSSEKSGSYANDSAHMLHFDGSTGWRYGYKSYRYAFHPVRAF